MYLHCLIETREEKRQYTNKRRKERRQKLKDRKPKAKKTIRYEFSC